MKARKDLLEDLFDTKKTYSRSLKEQLESERAIAKKARKLVEEIEKEIHTNKFIASFDVDAFIENMVARREKIDANTSKTVQKIMHIKRDEKTDKHTKTEQVAKRSKGA